MPIDNNIATGSMALVNPAPSIKMLLKPSARIVKGSF
jgi:hypothetical protein